MHTSSDTSVIMRVLGVVGLGAVALIHLLDAPGTFQDAAYKGWLYVALIAGSLATAGVLLRSNSPRAWFSAASLSAGAISAYLLSRTIGLPNGADDIGNWNEPLGTASLFVETGLIALSIPALSATRLYKVRSPFTASSQAEALS